MCVCACASMLTYIVYVWCMCVVWCMFVCWVCVCGMCVSVYLKKFPVFSKYFKISQHSTSSDFSVQIPKSPKISLAMILKKCSVVQCKFQKLAISHYLGPWSNITFVFQYEFQKIPKLHYLWPWLKSFSCSSKYSKKKSKVLLLRTLD